MEQIAALHADSWRTAYAGIMPDSYLSGPLVAEKLALWQARAAEHTAASRLFVAVDGLDVAGFAYTTLRSDGRLLLDNLHARPGRTGSGIGGRLLRHTLTWAAAEHRGRDLYLEVLRANTRAIAFYERHGARRTGERLYRFGQGFTLPEVEYTWTSKAVAADEIRVAVDRERP
ncbi:MULTISPECIES: GNAT family N-acetyltransferase [Streptomyces]|uniref:GNAT family N-acetyltransferase n=1 Tax=Streptomyces TaxID=1883 RepID=UPI001EF5F688|nr:MULTISPECIES: GNAT family N-acetyltransferase [Streptomyces]